MGIFNMSGFRDTGAGATGKSLVSRILSNTSLGMTQSKNIKTYAAYLEERVACFAELRVDYLRQGQSHTRLEKWDETTEKHLGSLLRLLKAVCDCRFFLDSIDNDVTVEAMRMIVRDLCVAYQVVSESMASILSKFQCLWFAT
jgi:hypothetical protein